jgi:hypothetical protein
MMGTVLEILLILVTSMVKFTLSPLLSLSLGYSTGQTLLITGIGGCLGVSVFFLSSGWIFGWLEDRRAAAGAGGRRNNRRSFTRANKIIVKVKRRQGLNGLAAITPIIISIPIGTMIAAKYFRHDRRTLPVLFSSVIFWDIIICTLWELAN